MGGAELSVGTLDGGVELKVFLLGFLVRCLLSSSVEFEDETGLKAVLGSGSKTGFWLGWRFDLRLDFGLESRLEQKLGSRLGWRTGLETVLVIGFKIGVKTGLRVQDWVGGRDWSAGD